MEFEQNLTLFDDHGRYRIRDFQQKPPFSSFLPGLAGLTGIPMWVFYNNRGQGICSFGINSKDQPILEFQPANKAYRETHQMGFRTFIRFEREGTRGQFEPFASNPPEGVTREMRVGMNDLVVEEEDPTRGLSTSVAYFTLPGMPFAALVRRLVLTNTNTSTVRLEVLDGLPNLVPFGVDDGLLKHMGRTLEAWYHAETTERGFAFYRLPASPADSTQVNTIMAGNFGVAFSDGLPLPAFVDPAVVFGMDCGFSRPDAFYAAGLQAISETAQVYEGRGFCAFFGASKRLDPGESLALYSLYGHASTAVALDAWAETLARPGFLQTKHAEALGLTHDLTRPIRTASGDPVFDHYCEQTFLDNLLRGGVPIVLGGRQVCHVFSRKHGDPERDYNHFSIAPEYYSQGNGNFRDVAQNRRNDAVFFPEVGLENARLFVSLIQPDGCNPLEIRPASFTLEDAARDEILAPLPNARALRQVLTGHFTPGQVAAALEADGADPAILEAVFKNSIRHAHAAHGEGYWIDHWTYLPDLLETYLGVFPERVSTLLGQEIPFYFSAFKVQPLLETLGWDNGSAHPFQMVREDAEARALLSRRPGEEPWARHHHGEGEVFRLPLGAKLLLLTLVMAANLDPEGRGVMMDAGKPGWYDALNGLPGLFGSSLPETCELLRLARLLEKSLPPRAPLPVEALGLTRLFTAQSEGEPRPADWVTRRLALETYRESVRLGFLGETIEVEVQPLLARMVAQLEGAIRAADSPTNLPPTYFRHTLVIEPNDQAPSTLAALRWESRELPLFLEGVVRRMKVSEPAEVKALHARVMASDLYDRALKMLRVNASLAGEGHAIGRARAFTPGWLENQSIWTHMAFKYLLELQRAGLHAEFFDLLRAHLPAFMDPDRYGRSPLENSSFLASSAHPDPALWGRGFVARLSGPTAEFLSMWVGMTSGQQPFRLRAGALELRLQPALPGWLFDPRGDFTFRFLDRCDITVHNPARVDTWQPGVKVDHVRLETREGEVIALAGGVIPAPYAVRTRDGEITRITLTILEGSV